MALGITIGLSMPPVVSQELPNRQEIYITLSNRKELLVNTNQTVKENQIIADTRGTTARKIAALQLQKTIYQQETFKPLRLVEVPPLLRPSLLREESKLQAATEQVTLQRQIINALTGEDENILLHETAKLRKLEQERDILQGELDSKKYQYSLELNRAESIKQSQQIDHQRQLAIWQRSELERRNNLLKLDLEIEEIKQAETLIRSPYNGIIQKVVWQSQRGNRLDVLVILIPTRPNNAAPGATPRATGYIPGTPNTTGVNPTGNPLPSEYPGLLAGLALISDPKFTSPLGTGHSLSRIG